MKQTRKQQKESTRKLIIEKAYEIYSSQGFSAPAKEIAKYAGVSEGTVFAHFSTVQNLIGNVIGNFSGVLTGKLHGLAHNSDLAAFLSAHIDVLSGYELFYSRLVEEQARLPDDARLEFICMQSAVSHHLYELLQKNERIKEIPQYIIFNCWIGLIHYYLLNRGMFCDDPSGSVLQKHKDELIGNFIIMITK